MLRTVPFWKSLALLLSTGILSMASTAEVYYNTNYWYASGPTSFDPTRDAQTGDPRAEFVGDAQNPGFYLAFDNTNDALNPQGRLLFRVRVAAYQGTNNPGSFATTVFIGIDGNGDGAIDVFAVADERGSAATNGVKLYYPACPNGSTTCFTGPPNTNLGSQVAGTTTAAYSVTGVKQNFNWVAVSNTTDPRTGSEPPLDTNVAGAGDHTAYQATDGFFSFAVDFASIQHATASRASNPFTLTKNSMMRFIAITAQQGNSLNQDVGGCPANTTTWGCGFTNYVTPNGLIPTPEPGTYATMAVSLAGLAWFRRRRKSSR